ncbi:MAG: hypothetical protein WBD28_04370, partial [Candidatus Zixiibacteriota bacterium]
MTGFRWVLNIAFIFLLSIILLSNSTFAQSVSTELYETEEDLKEGLERGELTYDEYLELLDLIRFKIRIDSEDTTRILFVPDVTSIEPFQPLMAKTRVLSPLNKTIPFIQSIPKRKPGLKGELMWQTYQEIDETEKIESYSILKLKDKRFSFDLRVEQDESKRWEAQKRSLKLFNIWKSTDVALGNFEKRVGLGLNLGHHPLFRYGLDDSLNINDSFLYPIRGRYNGMLMESKLGFLGPAFIYSKNRFGNLEDELFALDLNFTYKRSKIGFLFTRARLRNSSSQNFLRDDCQSIYLSLLWKHLKLTSEYAIMWNKEKGFALNINTRRKPYQISAYLWWYSSQFVHPHGAGVSNPDYETLSILDDLDFSYRSRQKGERGILFRSTYQISSALFWDFAFNQWRKNPDSDESFKLKIGGGYHLKENLLTQLHFLWNDNMELSGTDYFNLSWDWVYSFWEVTYLRLKVDYKSRKLTSGTKEYGDIQLKLGKFRVYPFDFNIWLKYSDPDFSSPQNSYFN